MSVEVSFSDLRNDTDGWLQKVEEGETVVITQRGKPVADLVPHRAGSPRWMTPSDVLAIRKLASADPTWPADLAKLRAETEDPGPIE